MDVPPSELFLKLLEQPCPTQVVDFPRYDEHTGAAVGKLRVRVLSQEEHEHARELGHKTMKDKGYDKDDLAAAPIAEVTADTIGREVLAMACLTENGPEDAQGVPMYGRIFRNALDLKKLRPSEIAVLFNAYLLVQQKFGPFEGTISSDADLNAWIKRLEEGGSEFPLLRQSLPALVELAFSLARRAYLLSAILDSLWPSLPDSFKSRLEGYSMGIGFYGEPAATSTAPIGESSHETSPVTTEQAARVAKELENL